MTGTAAALPKYQFYDAVGAPLANGTITTYLAGTTTLSSTWQDSDLTTLNTNPVVLDSHGECMIWLDSTKVYKVVLKNSAGVTQWSQDNIVGSAENPSITLTTAVLATYQGAASSNPATRTGGTALQNGDLYFNTSTNRMMAFANGVWYATETAGATDADLVAYTPAGTGAVASTVQTKLRESVSVKDFGAVGDGVTDDSAEIIAADVYAASVGKPLFFPHGIYIGTGLAPTTSWHGEKGSTIKNSVSANIYAFLSCNGQTNLTFKNLIFDGNVSADPGMWNSGNYNSFTGAIAFVLINSSIIDFEFCTFQNSVNGPIRIENSNQVSIDNCYVTRGRGNFGDGIYISNSHDCGISNTVVYDYTRIGVVTENGSYDCRFTNVKCEYGHDSGINYGGTEYNAGFWYENSGNHVTTSCTAVNNQHYGFLSTTGIVASLPTTSAFYVYSGCVSQTATTGYVASSNSIPSNVKFIGCESWDSAQGFYLTASLQADSFSCDMCHAEIAFSASVSDIGYAFNAGTFASPAVFSFTNSTTSYKNYDVADLNSTSSNSADISCFAGGTSRVVISNVRNIDSQYPIYVKQRTGNVTITIKNCYVYVPTINSMVGNSIVDGCLISYFYGAGAGNILVTNSNIIGQLTLLPTGKISLVSCDIVQTSGYVWLGNVASTVGIPLININNCRFEKDIATNNYVLRIQTVSSTPAPVAVMRGCTFLNTGIATATNAFVWLVYSSTPKYFSDCLSDSNVTYFTLINASLSNATPGNTLIVMH